MKWYADHFKRIYSFYPMSFWKFVKNTPFDKRIKDDVSIETYKEDKKSKSHLKGRKEHWGGRTSFGKFNSEYARRLILFYSCRGDKVIDPFAGRTRFKICQELNRPYTGFEINKKFVFDLSIINDDCINIDKYTEQGSFDFLFTCPPYWSVEKYSKNIDGDLSRAKTYRTFLNEYTKRLSKAFSRLKKNGVAVIVVSDFRKDGVFYSLHHDTIDIALQNDWPLYDVVILEMSPAARNCYFGQAVAKRRMLCCHEYALVFSKTNEIEKRKFAEDYTHKNKYRTPSLLID